jgi:hypothetical protein
MSVVAVVTGRVRVRNPLTGVVVAVAVAVFVKGVVVVVVVVVVEVVVILNNAELATRGRPTPRTVVMGPLRNRATRESCSRGVKGRRARPCGSTWFFWLKVVVVVLVFRSRAKEGEDPRGRRWGCWSQPMLALHRSALINI